LRVEAQRTPLIAGNWKCNPGSLQSAKQLAALVAASSRAMTQDKAVNPEIVVCPPSLVRARTAANRAPASTRRRLTPNRGRSS
jgi:triosephosphate isomerase